MERQATNWEEILTKHLIKDVYLGYTNIIIQYQEDNVGRELFIYFT